jgi:hypothetical protein
LLQKLQVFYTGKVIAEKIKWHIHIQVVFIVYFAAEMCWNNNKKKIQADQQQCYFKRMDV